MNTSDERVPYPTFVRPARSYASPGFENRTPDAANFSPGFGSFLDFARWLAAFIVFIGHLRNPLFIGYPDLPTEQQTLFVKACYFLSGLGSSSVIVFFVLSGFLVGGIGMTKLDQGKFNLESYAIDRVTRLFIVYIPILILTYLLDSIGNAYFGGSGLWNCASVLMCKNFSDFSALLSWKNFLTNLFMLQSFFGPYFGTDKPLWSLSYEFWFYVVFGLFAISSLNRGAWRVIAAVLLLGICAILGFRFIALLGVWLIGIGVSRYRGNWLNYPLASLICFAFSSFTMRFFNGKLESASSFIDYLLVFATAFSFGWLMLSVRYMPLRLFVKLKDINKFFASFSYTIYLLHFPLMLFVIAVISSIFQINQLSSGFLPNSLVGLSLYGGTFIIVVALAWGLAQVTEKQTDVVRALLKAQQSR